MNRHASALSGFLSERARGSVVRLRDPVFDTGVFTGFFISPAGHLVTAFHALKAHSLDVAAEFFLEVSFHEPGSARTTPQQVPARWGPEWFDAHADWAVLQLSLQTPLDYLPLMAAPAESEPFVDCSPMRIYGFTATDEGRGQLGSLSGEYLRAVPAERRFRVAFSVRSRGQSGGPVIDTRSYTAAGSVIGFRDDERLTADAALLHRGLFADGRLGVDLDVLAHQWRCNAIASIAAASPELSLLATAPMPPTLPAKHLAGREIVRTIRDAFSDRAVAGRFLHGPPGSGKSTIAADLVHGLLASERVEAAYWYDFEPLPNRSLDRLLRGLALYLLERAESTAAIEACLDPGFQRDRTTAKDAAIEAIRHGRHILVFDNVHFAQRDDARETMEVLRELIWAATHSESIIIFTSWDSPAAPLNLPVVRVSGLTAEETEKLLQLHDVRIQPAIITWLSGLAEDITCVEQFVRTPDWRQAAERGDREAGEPEELHRYWLNRYLADVPPAARRILLALAVLDAPEERSVVESAAAVENFLSVLDTLRHSPPLVRTVGGKLTIHSNVARAVLTTTDHDVVQAIRRRAAGHLRDNGRFLGSARLLADAGCPEAVTLLFERRDAIIARGGAGAMMTLTERLLQQPDPPNGAIPKLHAVLASCYNIRGDYTGATRHWQAALDATTPGTLEAAVTQNRYADSLRLASRYAEAKQQYARAADVVRGAKETSAVREFGWASLGLAKLERLCAEYSEAQVRYGEARMAFERIFHISGTIEADFGLGEVRRLVADWPGALAAYQTSLDTSRSQGNKEREAYALWGIGEVLRLTGQLDEAERNHQQGYRLCEEVGDTRSEGWALLGLAEGRRQAGRHDEAMAGYDAAIQRFTGTGSATELAHARLGMAEAGRLHGDIDLELYAQVLRTYLDKKLRHSTIQCKLATAMALRTLGERRQADRLLRRAQKLAVRSNLSAEANRIRMVLAVPDRAPLVLLNFP